MFLILQFLTHNLCFIRNNFIEREKKLLISDSFLSANVWQNIQPLSLINRLNQNTLVSLKSDSITREKVEINIYRNPHTIFLTVTNPAAHLVNKIAIERLFSTQLPLATILDDNKTPLALYKNMLVVVTENT